MFEFMFNGIFIIVPIMVGVIFIIVILSFVSPKFRGKLMSKNIKATKYMLNEVQDDLVDLESIAINTKKKVMDKNEDTLEDLSTREANIRKEGIKTTFSAIKEGLGNNIYCKHCGSLIDSDSKYCKKCGKEQ